jgi:hypothetical protein
MDAKQRKRIGMRPCEQSFEGALGWFHEAGFMMSDWLPRYRGHIR